jgi:acyl dehydratase
VGFDELRLRNALRPGDTVYVTSEITALQPSRSGQARGTAMTRYAMINQAGDDVVTFTSINLVYTADAHAMS